MWSWCVRASFVRVTHLLGRRRPRLATTATTRLRISSASSRSSNNAVSVTPRTRAPLCLMRAARDSTLLVGAHEHPGKDGRGEPRSLTLVHAERTLHGSLFAQRILKPPSAHLLYLFTALCLLQILYFFTALCPEQIYAFTLQSLQARLRRLCSHCFSGARGRPLQISHLCFGF